ncbi:FecR family protein [Filimonas lacunae]|uniref:FecR family protein n=1 Tax=Filimonas lacunae TaxID=477680 RepID=A0A173MBQ2_9BACT|nr:FecR domain-containing protein [Filimonas lacunae]BAV04952.1 anti-sigma factor [Filimonas lacunae]SIT33733.1 FecR family protein [Filimonas lacunae]
MMEQLNEEEIFLLLGKASGSLLPGEEALLEELFRNSPAATTAYQQLLENLKEAGSGKEGTIPLPHWRELTTEITNNAHPTTTTVKKLFSWKWAAAAASILVIAAGVFLYSHYSNRKSSIAQGAAPAIELQLADGSVINLSRQQGTIETGSIALNNRNKTLAYAAKGNAAAGTNRLTVPVGLDYKITLSDGTEIWLNSATSLQFPAVFTGNTREITVDGEAYLNVAPNAQSPFLVHLPGSTVRVMGTAFNINSYDSGITKIALVNGAVQVQSGTALKVLSPGKQATCSGGQEITETAFDERTVLGWRKGLFYFNNAPLSEISKVLPRWFNITVVIDDRSLLNRRFTGVINRNHPIHLFLEDLKVISGIHGSVDANGRLHFQ